jgi:thiamine biosynthesis lipoprotein
MTSNLSLINPHAEMEPVCSHEAAPAVLEQRFRAMGSDAQVIVVGGPPHLLESARRRIAELERRWSRFIPTSEVSRLNSSEGRPLRVSADTALLIDHAVEAWALTGGAFDPTVLRAVEAAGYDRSFELIGPRPVGTPGLGVVPMPAPGMLAGCPDIEVDRRPDAHPAIGAIVRIPNGCGFDAGGIGKGLAADLVVEQLMAAGAEGAMVNLGGDLRVEGESPDGFGWLVAVEHPHVERPLAVLSLECGGVATSTTLRRRWARPGAKAGAAPGASVAHHLIDPSTGLPSTSDVELAVVVGGAAWRAEVLAKAVLLRGAARSFDLVDERWVAAMTVNVDGTVATTPNFVDYAAQAPKRTLTERATTTDRNQS